MFPQECLPGTSFSTLTNLPHQMTTERQLKREPSSIDFWGGTVLALALWRRKMMRSGTKMMGQIIATPCPTQLNDPLLHQKGRISAEFNSVTGGLAAPNRTTTTTRRRIRTARRVEVQQQLFVAVIFIFSSCCSFF